MSTENRSQPTAGGFRPLRTRRQFLWEAGAGFPGLALTALLSAEGFFAKHGLFAAEPAASRKRPLEPRAAHFRAPARSCIFLYMYGGPSQMDLFDYKPELQKRDGQAVQMEIRRRSVQPSKLLASRRKFQR
jgi:hypothetical protein